MILYQKPRLCCDFFQIFPVVFAKKYGEQNFEKIFKILLTTPGITTAFFFLKALSEIFATFSTGKVVSFPLTPIDFIDSTISLLVAIPLGQTVVTTIFLSHYNSP